MVIKHKIYLSNFENILTYLLLLKFLNTTKLKTGMEGFEPSNVGIKNQCLNHLATFQLVVYLKTINVNYLKLSFKVIIFYKINLFMKLLFFSKTDT